LAGTGPLLFPVAAALTQAGADLVLVAEQVGMVGVAGFGFNLLRTPQKILEGLRYRTTWLGTPYRTNSWVTRADGEGQLRSVTVSEQGRIRTVDCDWLGAAMGLVPNTELGQLLGCDATLDGLAVDGLQQTSVAGVWAVGECTGVKGEDAGIVEGEIAGAIAAGAPRSSLSGSLVRARDAGRRFGHRLRATFAPRSEVLALAAGDTILCRCEDVRRDAIDPAWTQRQAKLWTRVGMGACQGAVCGPACSALFGWDGNAVRPPLSSPVVSSWAAALPPEH
jgi:NADPH-dependent 2,4-dienoyl-CoA reductase/sulfur reductase-like enzyme